MRTQIIVNKYSFVKNQSESDTYDVFIDGDIVDADTQEWLQYWGIDTSTSYKSLRDQILNCGCNNINIHINSGGGMVSDALAMGDFIKEQRTAGKNIQTFGKGLVASAATYPLMAAGKGSHISKNCFFMIHNVSGGAYGTVDEIEAAAKMMRKFNDCVRDEYAEMTGKPKETIAAWMNAETWFTGREACDNGFVKNCTATESAITNSISKDKWPFRNKAILNTINSSIKPAKNKDMKLKKIGNTIATSVMDALKEAGLVKDNKAGSIDLSHFEQKLTNSINTTIEGLATELNDGIKNGMSEALKGDEFKTLISNTISEILKGDKNPVADTIANATKDLVNKTELEKLTNDLATKLGTTTSKTTKKLENSNTEDDITDLDGWNR